LLLEKGYKFDPLEKILIPPYSSLVINTDNSILKQIKDAKLGRDIFFRTSKRGAVSLSTLKSNCTNYLNSQGKNIRLVRDFPIVAIRKDILNYPAMKAEIVNMNENSSIESYTYGYMNALLNKIFKLKDGYIVSPQSQETDGMVDFLIKKNNSVICVVESKAEKGKYSYTDLYGQATEYCNTNHSNDDCFIIVNKGPYMSFGVFIQDFHTVNKFDRKFLPFDGYIGLQVNANLEVKPVPQQNTFELQHKLYKADHSYEQNKSIYQSLNFIISNSAKGQVDLSSLDFGDRYLIDSNGYLNKVLTSKEASRKISSDELFAHNFRSKQISRDIMNKANFRTIDIASKARFLGMSDGTTIDTSLLERNEI